IVDGGRERAFEDGRKPAFHLLRIQAGILPGDGDHRDIDIGKDVRRRPQNNDWTEDENEQSQDNKGIGTAERYFDDPHLAFSSPSSRMCSGTAHTLVSQFTGRRPACSCTHRGVLASMAREVSVLLTPVCVSVQAALGVSTQAHSMPSEKTCPEHAR